MAGTDILIQNYNQILSTSLAFLGIILAIFFTLIALPLQNILGKYSQDLVNRVNRDKWLISCFTFFIILFGYDFTLLILPKSTIFILVSFLGGLSSLLVFSTLVLRVYYLLDVRNQIKDISKKIIKEIQGKKTRIRIFKADISLTDKLKDETEIIFDIIQKAVHEDRFEIVAFGLKEVVKIANNYISVKGINLGREYEDPFLDHIFDRLIDTESFVSKRNHPKIMNSIVDSIGSITTEILSTENIDPLTTNQWGPLSSLTFALIESLKNICIGPEIVKKTSYASGNACDQLINIGMVSIDNRYPYRVIDVVNELGEISRRTTEMNFYRGNRLSQSSNQGIIYLLEHSLEKLEMIEIDKSYILTSFLEEIGDIIKDYFKNEAIHVGSNPENIKPITSPLANHSIAVIYLKALKKMEEDEKDAQVIVKFMDNFLDHLDQNMELGMREERYFDVKDITDSLYTTGFNLISSFNPKNILLNEKINETLRVLYNPISGSLRSNARIIPFTDYLDNYASLLGFLFSKHRENTVFKEIIENGIKHFELDADKIRESPETHSYLRLIGLWLFKWMPDSEFLGIIKGILKSKDDKTITGNTAQSEDDRKDAYQKLYPQLTTNYWNLKMPFNNENALIKPFDDMQREYDEINKILFNLEDIERFEMFLKT